MWQYLDCINRFVERYINGSVDLADLRPYPFHEFDIDAVIAVERTDDDSGSSCIDETHSLLDHQVLLRLTVYKIPGSAPDHGEDRYSVPLTDR